MTNFINFTGGGDDRKAHPYTWPFHKLSVQDVHDLHSLEVRDIAENLAGLRDHVRSMVQLYRCWKSGYEQETDGFEKIHRAYEGIFVRRQFAEALRLYLAANRDYHHMRRVYTADLRQPLHRRAA